MDTASSVGPFYARVGPSDGPTIWGESPSIVAVMLGPDGPPMPGGLAFATGCVVHRGRPIATWRLEVMKVSIIGQWVCVGRVFLEAGEWLLRHDRAEAGLS